MAVPHDVLQICHLRDVCARLLEAHMTVDDVLGYYAVAVSCSETTLAEACVKFIAGLEKRLATKKFCQLGRISAS